MIAVKRRTQKPDFLSRRTNLLFKETTLVANLCIFHSPLTLLSNRTLNYSYNPLSTTQYILIIEFKIKKRLLSTWYARNSIKILLWIWEALFQLNVTY